MKSRTSGFTKIQVMAIVIYFSGIALTAYLAIKEHSRQPEFFRVWVKQTGNPGDLTFEEWRILPDMEKARTSTVVVQLFE